MESWKIYERIVADTDLRLGLDMDTSREQAQKLADVDYAEEVDHAEPNVEPEDHSSKNRRSSRGRKAPAWHDDYVC